MQDFEATAARCPMIHKWLEPWLIRLSAFPREEYRVLLSELEEAEKHNLEVLDVHLNIASNVCQGFERLVKEKQRLPLEREGANNEILNKLAEIRAIVGLHRLGFEAIEWVGSPDLKASRGGRSFLIEVTRLGASQGKRADVWDSQAGDLESLGYSIGVSWSGGKAMEALSEAIYREIEDKYPQLKNNCGSGESTIVWISSGRDYLTAGKYELPDVGLRPKMPYPKSALQEAVDQIHQTGLYTELSHVVLSLGRDKDDLIYPPLAGASSRR